MLSFGQNLNYHVYGSSFIVLLKTACASFASVSKCIFVYIKNILVRQSNNKFSFANTNKYSAGKMPSLKRNLSLAHGMAM